MGFEHQRTRYRKWDFFYFHISPLNNSKLTILDKGDKQYEAVLTTAYDGPAYIAIYNLKGQQLKFKKIVKSSVDSYVVRLDMSQVSTGMYIIRIGGKIGGSYFTEKFIVKYNLGNVSNLTEAELNAMFNNLIFSSTIIINFFTKFFRTIKCYHITL